MKLRLACWHYFLLALLTPVVLAGSAKRELDPRTLSAKLTAHRQVEVHFDGDVRLSGAWTLPAGTVTIRSRGTVVAEHWQLRAPGTHVRIEAPSIRLEDTHLDVSAARGGQVELRSNDPDGVIEIDETTSIDASGADDQGGRVLLAADRVLARGSLFARGKGRIEVEARSGLRFDGPADTAGGLIRLDPSNMVIGSFSGTDTNVANGTSGTASTRSPSANTGQLDATNLVTLLATNDVIVHTVAGGSASGITLPAGFVTILDGTGGDIEVQAPVVWSSSHFLWLLAHDDLIVRANVQNAGGAAGGSLVGIAGWDGTTFSALDADPLPSSVYGAGTGDAYILGPAGLGAPGIAFGSRIEDSVIAARHVYVLGSTDTNSNEAFAMVGYRSAAAPPSPLANINGEIRVTAKGNVTVAAGNGGPAGNTELRFAQIGHGGVSNVNSSTPARNLATSQGDLAGNVRVSAGGAIQVLSGPRSAYAQIGNGGGCNRGGSRGNVSGDVTVTGDSLLIQVAPVPLVVADAPQAHAMIGNGGSAKFGHSVQGNISGNISVTITNDITLDARGSFSIAEARIGHGGALNTTADEGNTTFTPSTIGAQSGSINLSAGRDLLMQGGVTSGYSQIGHGGAIHALGTYGASGGSMTVNVGRDATLQALGNTTTFTFRPVQIGHGGYALSAFTGSANRAAIPDSSLQLTVARELRMLGGVGQTSYVQVGHGGLLWSQPPSAATPTPIFAQLGGAAGNITVQASSIEMRGATGATAAISYTQIGNGGPSIITRAQGTASLGPTSGNIQVTTTGVTCAVPGTLPCGDLILAGGSTTDNGSYAYIGHGGEPYDAGSTAFGTQGNSTGSVTVSVAKETNLIDGPTDIWRIGHMIFSPATISSANVSLDTGTLDFTTATPSTSVTINNAQFWPRFVSDNVAGGLVDNVSGGSVTLRGRGTGADGNVVVQQPLTIPATTNPVVLRSTDDVTISAAMTNNGSSLLDMVADDAAANQNPPNKSATALFTIDGSGSIGGTGNTRVFAVSPAQFTPGSYVPPAQAFGVWYQTAGSPVVGANFKSSPSANLTLTKADSPDPVTPGSNLTYTISVTNNGPDTANGLSLSDTLPAGTTFVSLASPGGWTCSDPGAGNSGAISCTATSLAAGSAGFTLIVNVGPSVAAGTVLSNTATITSTTSDPSPGDESDTETTTVGTASADLSTTKTDSPDPITPGSNLTYTITVTNAGPSTASTVQLSDALPAGTTFVSLSSPGGWSCTTPAAGANGTITCNIATLAPGSAVFTLIANVDPSTTTGTVLSNTATASSTTSDPSTGNEADTELTTVATASADLLIAKVDTPDPVAPGANISYAISLTNNGPSTASNVQWSDALPAGTTFVSLAQPGGWTCTTPAVGTNGTVTCSNALMVPGTEAFTLVVRVAPSTAESTAISNTVNVASSTTDPSTGNESGSAQTTVGAASADLAITKVDTPDPVTPGTNLTYTITVTNNGPSDASTVQLSDTLPAGTTFVSLSSPGGWSCTTPAVGAGGTIDCSIATFVPGNAVFTLVVHVDSTVATATVLSNTATVSSATADPTEGNEDATATTTTGTASADLSASKSDTPDPVTPGSNLTYTINVTNAGPGNATSAQMSDTLPVGTTFVSLSSPGGWSCTTPAVGSGGTVTCNLATFSAGSAVFTLVVNLSSAAVPSSILTNTATVSSATTDPNTGNENGVTTTTVGPGIADLSMTKSDSPDPVAAGSNLTYTITATNAGPSNAANAHVIDALPTGTTFVSVAAQSGWTCTTPAAGANGTVDCSIASFGIGSATFTIVANVGSGVAGGSVLTNTATVSSASTDPSPGSESATTTTTVNASASATITGTKTASGTFLPGGNVTYTITLTNSSDGARADNPGDEFTDVLPSTLTLVSATATSGTAVATIATNTVTWNGAFAANASVTITIHATIHSTVPPGTTISNQGSLVYDQDGNGTNETSAVTDDPAVNGSANATAFAVAGTAAGAPTLSTLMLGIFTALIGAVAVLRLRF